MKTLFAFAAAAAASLLTGCVAVPVADPAVTVSGTIGGHARPYPPARVYSAPPPRYWGDRDGDGVPNGYDRRPRNPYRY